MDPYHHDYDPGYFVRTVFDGLDVLGVGKETIEKLKRNNEDYDNKKINYDLYWARFLDGYDELKFKFTSGSGNLQEEMMRLAELKQICETPKIRKAITENSRVEFDDENSSAE